MLSSATLRNDIKRFPKNIFQNSLLVLRKVVCLSCRNNNSNMKTEQYPIIAAHFKARILRLKVSVVCVVVVLISIVLSSCSENDPEPQISCEQLQVEISAAQKAIEAHYAKGNQGNQYQWELDLKALLQDSTKKANEFKKRAC